MGSDRSSGGGGDQSGWVVAIALPQCAAFLLAYCDMKTLYLRNVPPEVSQRLERMAAVEGMSVSSFVLRELAEVSKRADNPAILSSLPDLAIAASAVVADLDDARSSR